MFSIPTEITVREQSYAIRDRGDYRVVLDCFSALNDPELDNNERIYVTLLVFFDCFDDVDDVLELDNEVVIELYSEVMKFINCGEADSPGAHTQFKAYDWEGDAQLISSAINNVAKTEVRSIEYLHWWTFMGYFMSIGESTFSTVVSIRKKISEGKKLEKYESEFKRNNPNYFNWNAKTAQQQADDDLVKQLWNSSKVGE